MSVTWVSPDVNDEIEELDRTGSELGINNVEIVKAFGQGQLIPLSDRIWAHLENTDSWDTIDMKSVHRLGAEYGRDVGRLVDAFGRNAHVPAPIIMARKNSFYLVAGNTRLMVARALGIRPNVWCFKLAV